MFCWCLLCKSGEKVHQNRAHRENHVKYVMYNVPTMNNVLPVSNSAINKLY